MEEFFSQLDTCLAFWLILNLLEPMGSASHLHQFSSLFHTVLTFTYGLISDRVKVKILNHLFMILYETVLEWMSFIFEHSLIKDLFIKDIKYACNLNALKISILTE